MLSSGKNRAENYISNIRFRGQRKIMDNEEKQSFLNFTLSHS